MDGQGSDSQNTFITQGQNVPEQNANISGSQQPFQTLEQQRAVAWLNEYQSKFEEMSRACAEISGGFAHLGQAIYDIQNAATPNFGGLMDQVMGLHKTPPVPPPPSQVPQPRAPPSFSPSESMHPPPRPFSDFANPPPLSDQEDHNEIPSSNIINEPTNGLSDKDQKKDPPSFPPAIKTEETELPINLETSKTSTISVSSSPTLPVSAPLSPTLTPQTDWTEKRRRRLNNKFTRYYERRKNASMIDVTPITVADEIIALCETPPPISHLDRKVARYLSQHSVPKDPIVLAAIQKWIAIEIRERGGEIEIDYYRY